MPVTNVLIFSCAVYLFFCETRLPCSGLASNILAIRFTWMAGRVVGCQNSLEKLGYGPEIAKPMFGLWYNYCINGARPGGVVDGVSCFPHTDGQNLAIMMCVLFIYGK